MAWENWYLRFIVIVPLVAADLCPEPSIPNGVVRGEKEPNLFFGELTCNIGYHLVGASKNIKCRHGVWSHEELPVCAAIGACPSIPQLENGRNVPIQGSRGSAYRFKCNRGFKRFGERRTHCKENQWSHIHMPSCAKATCDETGMLDIPYGEGRAMMGGAVYKYRCNHGVEMDGSNTLVCDGEKWNGTVPDCNVEPNEPDLEVIVSGSVVKTVKPGDWVLVTCQSRGGHPVPDIGITMDGLPSGSKDFRNFRNSFTFMATEKDDGKKILCTTVNKVGTSEASAILQVHTPPKNAAISGPETIHHNDEFTFECSIEGGNPAPEITWTLRDHLGQTKEMAGENMGLGHSRMLLKTGTNERMLTINCVGENSQGIVSHTMHVQTQYLPKYVEITGPASVIPGEYAHFTCVTTQSFPVPTLKWTIKKSGDAEEVVEIDGEVSTEAVNESGVVAFSKTDILIENGINNASVECSVIVEGLGVKRSKQHSVNVLNIEEPVVIANHVVDKTEGSQDEINSLQQNEQRPTEELEKETESESLEDNEYLDINDDTSDLEDQNVVTVAKKSEIKELERSKILWIPLNPVENIEDYQNMFVPENDRSFEVNEPFLRPSDLPEAPMLKQEKVSKSAVSRTPVSVSADYSSSSTVSIQSVLMIITVCLSMLVH